jgi:hypothetical protein
MSTRGCGRRCSLWRGSRIARLARWCVGRSRPSSSGPTTGRRRHENWAKPTPASPSGSPATRPTVWRCRPASPKKRQEARARKAAIAEAHAYQRRVHDQAAQESLTRPGEALWGIERREGRERREKFEQLAAIDERAAGRFLLDTEPKKTPPAATRPRARHEPTLVTSLAALTRDASVAVRFARDQADGLALQARLAQGVRFRSAATNHTSIRGEKTQLDDRQAPALLAAVQERRRQQQHERSRRSTRASRNQADLSTSHARPRVAADRPQKRNGRRLSARRRAGVE